MHQDLNATYSAMLFLSRKSIEEIRLHCIVHHEIMYSSDNMLHTTSPRLLNIAIP